MQFAANPFKFHSLEGRAFKVTAMFDGWTKNAELPGSNHGIIPQTAVSQEMEYAVLTENEIQNLLATNWRAGSGKGEPPPRLEQHL